MGVMMPMLNSSANKRMDFMKPPLGLPVNEDTPLQASYEQSVTMRNTKEGFPQTSGAIRPRLLSRRLYITEMRALSRSRKTMNSFFEPSSDSAASSIVIGRMARLLVLMMRGR